jgi:hypothetical protein
MLLHEIALAASLVLSAPAPAPVAEIVPDVMPGDVELAVIPAPKKAQYGGGMLCVDAVALCAPNWAELRAGGPQLAEFLRVKDAPKALLTPEAARTAQADTLVLVGRPAELPALAERLRAGPHDGSALQAVPNNDQGYILSVRHEPGAKRNVIAIAALTGQGAYYAVQTLRQLSYVKDGKLYLREAEILDWPTFPARGSKRPSGAWEWALKANFSYAMAGDRAAAKQHFADWHMTSFLPCVAETRDGKKVDGLLDATPAGIQRALDWVGEAHAAGARDYCVHVDDQKEELTAESAKLFNNDYHAAMAHLLKIVYAAMKKADPQAVLYFCPVPYWTLAEYETSAAKLRAAGGLPPDCGLMLCGPEVTSNPIPVDDVARYSRLYGAQRKAIIYDNHLRDLDFGPIEARDPALAKVIIGVSPERGTATTRATRLDWGWNPEAYDPDRSLRLACREFAGFANWRKLYDTVTALEYALPRAAYLPRAEAVARTEAELARCGKLMAEMREMPNAGLDGRLTLQRMASVNYEHAADGLIDDAALCRRALTLDEIARVMTEGLSALYPTLPARADGLGDAQELTRADFLAVWLFDEGQGKVAKDLTPNKLDGALDGAAAFAEGRFGKALALPKSAGSVKVAPHAALKSETFTLMAWVKYKPAGRYGLVIERLGEKEEQRQALLVAHCEDGHPYLHGGAGSMAKVDDDRWHHLAATFDGRTHRFYVDGKLQGQTAAREVPRPEKASVNLGAHALSASTRPTGYAYNIIDQLPSGLKLLAESRKELIARSAFREIDCPAANGGIVLDGAADDAAWAQAPEGDGFVVSGAGTPAAPAQDTRFRLLRDDRNLYLFARIGAAAKPSGKAPRDDVHWSGGEFLRVLIDPKHTHGVIYEFWITPDGDRYDGLYPIGPAAGPTGLEWNSGWKSATKIGATEWTAELAIPLAALGISPRAGDVMGFQVWHGRTLWSYVPRWWGVQEPSELGHVMMK